MAENIVNKSSKTFGGGVNPSSNACFIDKHEQEILGQPELILENDEQIQCHLEPQVLCHPELVSGSKKEIPNQVRNDSMIEVQPLYHHKNQSLCHSELV